MSPRIILAQGSSYVHVGGECARTLLVWRHGRLRMRQSLSPLTLQHRLFIALVVVAIVMPHSRSRAAAGLRNARAAALGYLVEKPVLTQHTRSLVGPVQFEAIQAGNSARHRRWTDAPAKPPMTNVASRDDFLPPLRGCWADLYDEDVCPAVAAEEVDPFTSHDPWSGAAPVPRPRAAVTALPEDLWARWLPSSSAVPVDALAALLPRAGCPVVHCGVVLDLLVEKIEKVFDRLLAKLERSLGPTSIPSVVQCSDAASCISQPLFLFYALLWKRICCAHCW